MSEFGKAGGGGLQSSQYDNVDRRERLKQIALDMVDVSKDPYIISNHLGTYDCRLCLTVHNNIGNYLAHTQGKKHQTNLARRAAREQRDNPGTGRLSTLSRPRIIPKKTIKIGRPGYKIIKQRDPETGQLSLLFQIDYPEIEPGVQPRYQFMSSFVQKIEVPNRDVQYLLFAAEPYETIAFKIPNKKIDRTTGPDGKFFTHWDRQRLSFTVQLYFEESHNIETDGNIMNPHQDRVERIME
ncbi:hypothetical protein SAMD00019534_055200, partial [Acytostelium subglobosum LB1]|uniref:hypothetical protein n=1 Tax=Acytostelium subglobosum LB1 TaxID=1410327 RepID=UPI00064483B6